MVGYLRRHYSRRITVGIDEISHQHPAGEDLGLVVLFMLKLNVDMTPRDTLHIGYPVLYRKLGFVLYKHIFAVDIALGSFPNDNVTGFIMCIIACPVSFLITRIIPRIRYRFYREIGKCRHRHEYRHRQSNGEA